jgi:hypothetical protein
MLCRHVETKMTTIFEVFRDERNFWHARRNDGLVEGVFVDRISAIRFAKREAPAKLRQLGVRFNNAIDGNYG